MDHNSDFDRFLKNHGRAQPGMMPPAWGLAGPSGPAVGPPSNWDPQKDPRYPLIAQCPIGCKGFAIQLAIPVPNTPQSASENWKARCIECLCWWEVSPDARIVNLRPFTKQIADAMLEIQRGLAAQGG